MGDAEVLPLDLERLDRSIPVEARAELLPLFLAETRDLVASLRTAWERGKLEAAQRCAHALKGTAGNLGALQLHRLAEEIESALKGGRAVFLDPRIATLPAAFRRLELELSSLLDPSTPGEAKD